MCKLTWLLCYRGLEILGFRWQIGEKKNMNMFEYLDVILGVLGVWDVLGVYSYGLYLLRRFAQLHLSSEIGLFEGQRGSPPNPELGSKYVGGLILAVRLSYSTKSFRTHSPTDSESMDSTRQFFLAEKSIFRSKSLSKSTRFPLSDYNSEIWGNRDFQSHAKMAARVPGWRSGAETSY